MPSTYSTRIRAEKQADGENSNTWGSRFNSNTMDMIDAAIGGMASYTLSGAKTLTSNNGAADEARMMFQNITGGTGGTVTIPNVEKTYLVRNASSGDVIFTTGSGTTATVAAGSVVNVICAGGNLVYKGIGTADSPSFVALTLTGGQITFPATAVPSADVNTLDDYEEGTWTPGLTINSSAAGITFSTATGVYTKIGRQVRVSGVLQLTAKGASVGNVAITGLPFTALNTSALPTGAMMHVTGAGITSVIGAIPSTGGTNLLPYNQTATTVTQLTDANMTNTTLMHFAITYFV